MKSSLMDRSLKRCPAAVQGGGSAMQTAPYAAHHVAGDAALHHLVVLTLLEVNRVDLDAGETFGEAGHRQPDRV